MDPTVGARKSTMNGSVISPCKRLRYNSLLNTIYCSILINVLMEDNAYCL